MGDVVDLAKVPRPPQRTRAGRGEARGEIAFFTGVRIERWAIEPTPEQPEPRGPRPRTPRRRRGG